MEQKIECAGFAWVLQGGGGAFSRTRKKKCMSSKVLEICLTQAIKFSEFMLQVLFVDGKVN